MVEHVKHCRNIQRDRHGRGPRSPLLYPGLPAWKTRKEKFDALMARLVEEYSQRWPAVAQIEFGVEDVPPSDPAPWEDYSQILARLFPADRRRGLGDRIVVYRLPIIQRAQRGEELEELLRALVLERISRVVAIPPEDLEEGL